MAPARELGQGAKMEEEEQGAAVTRRLLIRLRRRDKDKGE